MPTTSFILQLAVAAGALIQPALGASSVYSPKPSHVSTKVATGTRPVGTGSSQATACAAIGAYQKSYIAKYPDTTDPTDIKIPAAIAHECLLSVPLNKTAAAAFIKWYKPYLEFQSTDVWLKSPPSSYKQPATDLLGGMDNILSNINGGKYKGEYEFEVAVTELINSAHDGHLGVSMPLVNAFAFGAPWQFLSISSDGVKVPDVYVSADVVAKKSSNSSSWTPSVVKNVNGQSAIDYFTAQAKKSRGQLEPHGDWNSLFSTPANKVAGESSPFSTTSHYPGNDTLTLTFANGTTVSKKWVSVATIILTGVKSGQDLYDLQVAPPANSNNDSSSNTTTTTTKPKPKTQWGSPYPSPVVVQKDLGVKDGGFMTGYFLNKSSIAVISLPSFEMQGDSARSFQEAVAEFLLKCKQAGMKKLIVDVQANGGGTVDLGFDLFKQIFPKLNPFSGSQLRATPATQIIASAIGAGNATVQALAKPLPFSFQSGLDVNNKPFADAQSFIGPVQQHGDNFSSIIRTDFNDADGEEISTSYGIVISGYGNMTNVAPQYFDAKDVVLFTDAYCGSTCTIFAEELRTQAGVKRVVIGGRPETGPMQAVGGVRGAQIFSLSAFASVIAELEAASSEVDVTALPSAEDPPINPGNNPEAWGFNLRNQISQTDFNTPLQFAYQPADCRIWYTAANLADYSVLWQNVADAIWGGGNTTCVAGSTGVPSSTTNGTSTGTPPSSSPPVISSPAGSSPPGSSPPSSSAGSGPSSSPTAVIAPANAGSATFVSMGALFGAAAVAIAGAL